MRAAHERLAAQRRRARIAIAVEGLAWLAQKYASSAGVQAMIAASEAAGPRAWMVEELVEWAQRVRPTHS